MPLDGTSTNSDCPQRSLLCGTQLETNSSGKFSFDSLVSSTKERSVGEMTMRWLVQLDDCGQHDGVASRVRIQATGQSAQVRCGLVSYLFPNSHWAV